MQDFANIDEKLKRAKENVYNLDLEIGKFFQECDYPVLQHDDSKATLKAIEYHKNLFIPPRFSVIAGETIHHLRSCFDHIVWHCSIVPVKNFKAIDFPVFEVAPINHDSRKRYKRKVEGIADVNVLSLIESLQPHNATDPFDEPL